MINFLAAIGIGLVIGLVGGFALRGKQSNAVWLSPVLAIVGALIASVLAFIIGDPEDYGWKEPILQVALAVVGAGIPWFLASRNSASADAKAGS